MMKSISKYRYAKPIAIICIVIFHLVGLIGIGIYKSESIIHLTWANLSVTFGIGLLFFETRLKTIIIPILIASIIGLTAEAIGVNTGYLFGEYEYGSVLGLKIFEVPYTIGVLWAGLSIATKNISGKITKNPFLIALIASLIMVVFDFIMEPVATKLNFWNWAENNIPISNYVSWFFVSLFIQILWRKVDTKNSVFDIIFVIQALFFIILNILL